MTRTITAPLCPVCGFELPDPLPSVCPRPSCGVEFLPGDAGPVLLRTFRLVGQSALFVLPFSFPETDGSDPVRRVADSGRWRPRVFSATDPADVDRTEYFLPYIRRFLFPTLYQETGAAKSGADSAPACRHFEFDLARLGGGPQGVDLTLRSRDDRKKVSHVHSLRLVKAELILFSYRVGFLVLGVECLDRGATFFDQMNVVASLRTIAPLYRGFEMPELESGAVRFDVPRLVAFLLAEFGGALAPSGPEVVLAGAPLSVKPIYDDRMMVYTFSCLDRDTCLADATRCQALLHRTSVVNFDREASRLPESDRIEKDPAAWLRTRWQGFSKDGGSLVVFNTDAYHERYAGVYHTTYYFDVFLLAALQRVTLLTLFERLSDIQALTQRGGAGRRLLRRVRRDLLLFKNQCWFSQITNRERGLLLWKKWQKTLETRTLCKEVNEQSAELDAYMQTRYRERIERVVRLGGFLVVAIPFVWGLDNFFEKAEWARVLRWVVLAVLLLGSAAAAWYLTFRRSDEE
jgi:hypothetical protein